MIIQPISFNRLNFIMEKVISSNITNRFTAEVRAQNIFLETFRSFSIQKCTTPAFSSFSLFGFSFFLLYLVVEFFLFPFGFRIFSFFYLGVEFLKFAKILYLL